ncbi:hypothetical protein SEPCBS119000_005735 [Sporothrix epigloea]|uniref:HNH nuclease domain-containing protein n=1 Tax=Sporothrix epigloea TaxID=1892477 RepID=A0ABP0E0B3_9PEZI
MSLPSEEYFVERARQLYESDSQAAEAWMRLGEEEMETVKVLTNDIPHDFEHPHHYITDVEERQQLFSKIRPLISQTVDVNSTVLATFMVIPLSEMRPIVERLAEYNPSSMEDVNRYIISSTHRSLISNLCFASPAIAAFLAKQITVNIVNGQPVFEIVEAAHQKSSPILPSLPEETGCPPDITATPSHDAVRRAKARDGHTCVLTGIDSPEAVHIYPSSADERSGRTIYLNMLVSFWGEEKAEAWSNQYFNSGVTESPKNLLCLNRQLHYWWRTCRLALRPIQTLDPYTIKVQVHWLRPSATKPTAVSGGSFDDISSLCGGENDYRSWGQPPVVHRKSGLPLRTGQIFTIQAEDPEDLPSFELLEMQWNFLRIAAMSGAAEPDDELSDEDEDENGHSGSYILSNFSDNDVEELDLNRTEAQESDTAQTW